MITGELKSKIDRIWDAFWSGGIYNPLEVIEQITYPRGRARLALPKVHEVESVADPKDLLHDCLLRAADVSGRRREAAAKRFNQHRRQLLERLDPTGGCHPTRQLGPAGR